MNVFTYLSTIVFLTGDGEAIDPELDFDRKNIKKISLSYEKYCQEFGDHEQAGALATTYPGLFRDDIAKSFHPGASADHARFLIAINLMSAHIHYYAEPRYDSDGEMLFCELTGYEQAENFRKSYVMMVDLS